MDYFRKAEGFAYSADCRIASNFYCTGLPLVSTGEVDLKTYGKDFGDATPSISAEWRVSPLCTPNKYGEIFVGVTEGQRPVNAEAECIAMDCEQNTMEGNHPARMTLTVSREERSGRNLRHATFHVLVQVGTVTITLYDHRSGCVFWTTTHPIPGWKHARLLVYMGPAAYVRDPCGPHDPILNVVEMSGIPTEYSKAEKAKHEYWERERAERQRRELDEPAYDLEGYNDGDYDSDNDPRRPQTPECFADY